MEMNNSSQLQSVTKDRRLEALGDLRIIPDEILCAILVYLTPRDIARLSCVSSVMYIFCNEEPLWMSLCLENVNTQLQYRGSWKKTTLHQLHLPSEYEEPCRKPLHFDGFYSLFLYRRLYRCYTKLDGFSFDHGNVKRKTDLSLEEFRQAYDGKQPVLISGLADTWPARHAWTTGQLLLKYGDTKFRISQRSSKKVAMQFKDYLSYTQIQHDEDPLYIFDDKFGEVAPDLLKDYSVPNLFKEDFFDVLDRDQRPAYRWLIIGPERSGASWHVDPALTSAWNTLLCGHKRWALYPPGKVPIGVTVHVNEEDGDVNVETPTSLQWWLDFYPLLADEDKPIECTQLPGETIFVPSGWWHCVLNLETTIAVTQNFVNSTNFEFVCLDLAPGYQHKGVCRAGLLALDEGYFQDAKNNAFFTEDNLSNLDPSRKEKRVRISESLEYLECEDATGGAFKSYNTWNPEFSYDINFLSMFLDKERDHYNSVWSSSNCIGQREMREWLWKLWLGKPGLRNLIWKGACLALNAGKWSECMEKVSAFHELPSPGDEEKLPVGMGSNPVYLVCDNVIKIYVEDGLEASLNALGTELEFYSLLSKFDSPLKNHVPGVLASGILVQENGAYTIVPWDGKGVPDVIAKCNMNPAKGTEVDFPFGVWNKKQFEYSKSGMSIFESINSGACSSIWPYIVTERCKGKILAEIRDSLSKEEILNLASFLGEQLRNLHFLPLPPLKNSTFLDSKPKIEFPHGNNGFLEEDTNNKIRIPAEWEVSIRTLNRKKKDITSRLTKWGDPIPKVLIDKADEYIPEDFEEFLNMDDNALLEVGKSCSWIHSDVMDDNIHIESCYNSEGEKSWCPNHILDFSNLSVEVNTIHYQMYEHKKEQYYHTGIRLVLLKVQQYIVTEAGFVSFAGDPICDLIPIHLDVFRGDPRLLKRFLESYKLPLVRRKLCDESVKGGSKRGRLSYLAMCYCILHDDNILGAIFGMWKELRTAKSWEEVEEAVWGDLNNYIGILD
ncbi:hypothetical protein LguiA_006431 [Lonicera macranthoides]